MEAEVKAIEKKPQNLPYHSVRGRRVVVRIFKNPGYRCSNWSWDVIQRGTGRTDSHYMPIDSISDGRKTIAKAERFIKRRQWFWWFFKMID